MSNPRKIRMPLRHWRWYWLSQALRLLAWPLVGILSVPYFAARGFVWAVDHGSGQYYRFRMYLLKLDMDRSGWEPEQRYGPPIQLSQKWKERIP